MACIPVGKKGVFDIVGVMIRNLKTLRKYSFWILTITFVIDLYVLVALSYKLSTVYACVCMQTCER